MCDVCKTRSSNVVSVRFAAVSPRVAEAGWDGCSVRPRSCPIVCAVDSARHNAAAVAARRRAMNAEDMAGFRYFLAAGVSIVSMRLPSRT